MDLEPLSKRSIVAAICIAPLLASAQCITELDANSIGDNHESGIDIGTATAPGSPTGTHR